MNLQEIQNYQFPVIEEAYTVKDSILYALGLGYGADPLNKSELRYVTEDDQLVVPTQCYMMAYPGFWAREISQLGIDWVRIVHGEQKITLLRPLPTAARVQARHRISAVADKGKDKGAVIYFEKEVSLASTGEVLAQARSTIFARGDGGQGGFGDPPESPEALEALEVDTHWEMTTSKRAALIYRLSGDFNPLHSNLQVAREAGFDRPILHGMCTMGIACRAIIETYCDSQPARMKSLFVRFSQPVFPGETIRIEFFEERDVLRFRAYAMERGVVVLDRCTAEIRN